MKKGLFLSIMAAATAAFTWSSALQAGEFSPELSVPVLAPYAVTPLDTFTFDIAGFNSAGTTGYLLTPAETATFGGSQTYTGAGVNGQDISVASSETVNGATTTDVVTVSTPTNFLTTTTVNGTTITQLQFDLGDANSGSNTIDYSLAVTGNTATGSVIYSGGTLALTPGTTLTNNNRSLAAVESVGAGTTAITGFTVHSFTYSITYNTIPVPEPSSLALGALGLFGCAVAVARRRRSA